MLNTKSVRVSRSENMTFLEKLAKFQWGLFALVVMVLVLSVIVLYSAGTQSCSGSEICQFGSWRPYAVSQIGKIIISLIVMFIAAFMNIKFWLKTSYLIYAAALLMIILVTFAGHTGMGAQRWLNLGFIHIQPSEFIKIAMVVALARYFAWKSSSELSEAKTYIAPALMMLVPFALIVIQPDLGTAMSLGLIAAGIFWIVGAKKKWFAIVTALFLVSAPIVWSFGLHGYQKDRILTFISPSKDLSGAGYQINQAKIAFGSGGMIGKGYLQGTQSHLSFLPEKQTDFIFTMMGEEMGFAGTFGLILIYSAIILMLFRFAKTTKNRFGQLISTGFMINFFVYYFLNIAMVLGILPTVGVPLPLMSFGGSSLLSLMFGFGLVQNARINKDQQLSAKGY
jgi:rod shape determining protein RodA